MASNCISSAEAGTKETTGEGCDMSAKSATQPLFSYEDQFSAPLRRAISPTAPSMVFQNEASAPTPTREGGLLVDISSKTEATPSHQANSAVRYIGTELDDTAPIWRMYRNEITAHDKEVTLDEWNKTLDILLIFSGLFSAVVTTFVVASYPLLQAPDADYSATALYAIAMSLNNTHVLHTLNLQPPPPVAQPTSTYRTINALWFSSLFLSLAVAFFSILSKQWLVEYNHRMSTPVAVSSALLSSTRPQGRNAANSSAASLASDGSSDAATRPASRSWVSRRHFFFGGLEGWHVSGFVTQFLPFLLHIGLFLFLSGLALLLWSLDHIVAWIFLSLTVLLALFYLGCIILPIIWQECPSIPLVNRLIILVPITILKLCVPFVSPICYLYSHAHSTVRLFNKILIAVLRFICRSCTRRTYNDYTSDATDIETGINIKTVARPMSLQRAIDTLCDRRRGVVPIGRGETEKQQDDVTTLSWLLLVCSSENANQLAFQAIGALPLSADLEELKPALQGMNAASILGSLQPATITAVEVVRAIRTELRLSRGSWRMPRLGLDLPPAMTKALSESDLPDAQLLRAVIDGDRAHLRAHIINWLDTGSIASTATLLLHYPSVDAKFLLYLLLLMGPENLTERAFAKLEAITDNVKCRMSHEPSHSEDRCMSDRLCDHLANTYRTSEDLQLRAVYISRQRGWARTASSVQEVKFRDQHDIFVDGHSVIKFMASDIWLANDVLSQVNVHALRNQMIGAIRRLPVRDTSETTRREGRYVDFGSDTFWSAAFANFLRMCMTQATNKLYEPLDAVFQVLQGVVPELGTEFHGLDVAYYVSFLVTSNPNMLLEIFRHGRSRPDLPSSCTLANSGVHKGSCKLQCIPSLVLDMLHFFVDQRPIYPSSDVHEQDDQIDTLAMCAIIRILALGALSSRNSSSFWWPINDSRIIELLSTDAWSAVCQRIRFDGALLCPVGIAGLISEPEIKYCVALDNLLPVFGLQRYITERLADTLFDLVKRDGVEGFTKTTEDWLRILRALVIYFVREADRPSVSQTHQEHATQLHQEHVTLRWRLGSGVYDVLWLLGRRGQDVADLTEMFFKGVETLFLWTWNEVSDPVGSDGLISDSDRNRIQRTVIERLDPQVQISAGVNRSQVDIQDLLARMELATKVAAALCLSRSRYINVVDLAKTFGEKLFALLSWAGPETLRQERLAQVAIHLAGHCAQLQETWLGNLANLFLGDVSAERLAEWTNDVQAIRTWRLCKACQ